MFGSYLDAFREVVMGNLPVAVGGGVAVLVLTALFVLNRRRRAYTPPPPAPTGDEKALNWAPPEQSYADRRGSVRRDGAAVRVQVTSATLRNGMNDGFVTDRSTGGLRLVMPTAVAPGSTLQVRAANAPDNIGFTTIIVRSCRKNGDYFELGCEFEKTPPWNVLLLFG